MTALTVSTAPAASLPAGCMPLPAELRGSLDSRVADLANYGERLHRWRAG